MSLPPPPGLKQPASLPPRPPPSQQSSSFKPAYSSAPSYSSPSTAFSPAAGHVGPQPPAASRPPAFTAFAPRAVASSNSSTYRTHSPVVSAAPSHQAPVHYESSASGYPPAYHNVQKQQPYTQGGGASYYGESNYNASAVPHIANPFPLPSQERKGYGRDSGMDPETEAQIAQWQSAYVSREGDPASQTKAPARPPGAPTAGPNVGPQSYNTSASSTPTPGASGKDAGAKTVVRSGGGQTWTDSTLLEWDPAHFRLFVGNLAGEVTDDSLKKAFAKYPSIQKARVIRDKRTEKSKGYGFVSFSDGDDYFKAAREMQGKYIGSHPVLLRRAMTEVRPVSDARNKKGKKGGNGGKGGGGGSYSGAGGGKPKGDGVKKQGYTKGGLKILG